MTQIIINIDPKLWWIPVGLLIMCLFVYFWTAAATVAKNDWQNYDYRKPKQESDDD